ncbi:hypothetical protein [Streptomyces sp. KR55]
MRGTLRWGGRGMRWRYKVPLRPPVPPQRHDCPQLRPLDSTC